MFGECIALGSKSDIRNHPLFGSVYILLFSQENGLDWSIYDMAFGVPRFGWIDSRYTKKWAWKRVLWNETMPELYQHCMGKKRILMATSWQK